MPRNCPVFAKVREALPRMETDGKESARPMIVTILEEMSGLTDSRYKPNCRHIFAEVLAMAFFAILAGADDWVAVADYCEQKRAWLARWLTLPGGVPSHDTFQRCLRITKRDELLETMAAVVVRIVDDAYRRAEGKAFLTDGTPVTDIISIDGKAMLGSGRAMTYAGEVSKLMMLNAWSSRYGLCLAAEPIPEKTNEIPTSQRVVKGLDVRGKVVTVDALNTQTALAEAVKAGGGEYCLALKANRPSMLSDVGLYFADPGLRAGVEASGRVVTETEKAQGKLWTRTYLSTPEVGWQSESGDWRGLRSFGMAERRAEDLLTGEVSVERCFYLLSFDDVELFAMAARSHWGVENSLHWQLDASFGDDDNTTAEKESAAALSIMKRFVLSLINIVKGFYKGKSVRSIRRSIGWGDGEEEFMRNLAKSGHLV